MILLCLNCNIEFKRKEFQKYCSHSCFINHKFGEIVFDNCMECGKQISYRSIPKNFCSSSCSATYNNKKRKRLIRVCHFEGCNNTFSRKQKFCSISCSAKDKRMIVTKKWLNGDVSGHNKHGTLKPTIREYIKNRDDRKCTVCGLGEKWNDKHITLQIDHIDGNWRNSVQENLRTICPNCHSQTETYGSKNKSGRSHNRR